MYTGGCKCSVPRGTAEPRRLSGFVAQPVSQKTIDAIKRAGGGVSAPSAPQGGGQIRDFDGMNCPAGWTQVGAMKQRTSIGTSPFWVTCSAPVGAPAPAPAPPPAPIITVTPTITVSPNLQQQFTPQVSPIFQQSSGSGSQSADTTQHAGGPQSGAGGGAAGPGGSAPSSGGGLTSADLLAILNSQAEQARAERAAAAAEAEARRKEEREYLASEQAAAQAAADKAAKQAAAAQAAYAIHSQYTGPTSSGTVAPVVPKSTPIAQPSKNRYIVPAAAVILLALTGVYIVNAKKSKKGPLK